jgi:hypothetical protein
LSTVEFVCTLQTDRACRRGGKPPAKLMGREIRPEETEGKASSVDPAASKAGVLPNEANKSFVMNIWPEKVRKIPHFSVMGQ